jgi:RNA polymerase sigma factor (sigma-70 family)
MTELDDHELLAEFARNESEEAFATLVTRHVNLVYSAARRFSGNPHHAQEITQAVFIILARKAGHLRRGTVLSGWLYQTARLTAANLVKGEIRRQRREQEAYMQSSLNEPNAAAWEQIAPLLDEAMGRLGETDRNALVLRFFENKSAQEVGTALKLSEPATHKRVTRALEKLRKFFTKRGVTLTATIIAGAVSANSVQAAPVGLAVAVTAAAVKGAVVGSSTLTLIKGVLKIMAWTKAKTAIVVAAGVVLAAGTSTMLVKKIVAPSIDDSFWDEFGQEKLKTAPPVLIVRETHFPDSSGVASSGFEGDRFGGRNMPLVNMLACAYGLEFTRMVLPPEYAFDARDQPRFDFLDTIANQPREKLQTKLKQQFNLAIKLETRETDVFLLKVKDPNAPGLKNNNGSKAHPLISLVWGASGFFGKPVIDQTGLKGSYEFSPQLPRRGLEAARELYKQALLDQLGLELVPSREPIEMLIVEKVK